MNYYILDMHLGHGNVLRFDGRPFSTVEEMDKIMIANWNMRVREDDHVYILADFSYKAKNVPESYSQKLNGHKHLIWGNHDGVIEKSSEAQDCFETMDTILRISDEGRGIFMGMIWNV